MRPPPLPVPARVRSRLIMAQDDIPPIRTHRQRNRRGLLALGAGAALIAGLPRLWALMAPSTATVPHPDLPGFRILEAGSISGRIDPFAGIADPDLDKISTVLPQDLCAALFQTPRLPGAVQVAFFTDINCPYCRIMEGWIAKLPPTVAAVTWHDLPLLGPGSVAGARAIGAARLQGAEPALRARLHRTRFQPDAAYLTNLAGSLGVDAPRLLTDMQSPAIEARISESLGLATLFGIPGTPALVVGDTLAVGALAQKDFDDLLAQAATNPASAPCGA